MLRFSEQLTLIFIIPSGLHPRSMGVLYSLMHLGLLQAPDHTLQVLHELAQSICRHPELELLAGPLSLFHIVLLF